MHITMDLRKLFGQAEEQTGNTEPEKEVGTEETSNKEKQEKVTNKKIALKDWGDELQRRLDANATLDPETRSSAGEIELQFWKDYFNSNWPEKVATKLIQIDTLQRVIKKIGFDPVVNPFLAFLVRPFGQKIVEDDLLNSATFKALAKADSKNYLADSEFVKENNYNILYRTKLYKKTPADIFSYLKLQHQVLPRNATVYTKSDKAKNLQIFLVQGIMASKDANAELRTLEDADKMAKKLGYLGLEAEQEPAQEAALDSSTLDKLAKELTTSEQLIAALQYTSLSTNSKEAANALEQLSTSGISSEKLLKATSYVAKLFAGKKLDKKSAADFVDVLVKKLN